MVLNFQSVPSLHLNGIQVFITNALTSKPRRSINNVLTHLRIHIMLPGPVRTSRYPPSGTFAEGLRRMFITRHLRSVTLHNKDVRILLPMHPFNSSIRQDRHPYVIPTMVFRLNVRRRNGNVAVMRSITVPGRQATIHVTSRLIQPHGRHPIFLSMKSLTRVNLRAQIIIFHLAFIRRFGMLITVIRVLRDHVHQRNHLNVKVSHAIKRNRMNQGSPNLIFVTTIMRHRCCLIQVLVIQAMTVRSLNVVDRRPIITNLSSSNDGHLFNRYRVIITTLLRHVRP